MIYTYIYIYIYIYMYTWLPPTRRTLPPSFQRKTRGESEESPGLSAEHVTPTPL